MNPVAPLADLLALLLSEQELRRLFAAMGLDSELPGAGVSHATLCHEAATLLLRRGLADRAFFQSLADRSGRHFLRVEEVAASLGVTGLRAPAAASPAPALPAETPARPSRRRAPARVGVATVALGAGAFAWWQSAPPCTGLDEVMATSGFQPSPGLSARLLPGTVLRVCEDGPTGAVRLQNPVVWATASHCFSAAEVQEHNWEIPQSTCGSGAELSLDARDLASWLPGLSAHASALKEASLELQRPRLRSMSELGLNEGFDPACAARLAASLAPPVQASWFQVVREAIVLDGIRLRVHWKGHAGAEARLAAEDAAEDARAGGLDLRLVTHAEDETVWEAAGPLVLGWRGATARPELEGGAAQGRSAGGCP